MTPLSPLPPRRTIYCKLLCRSTPWLALARPDRCLASSPMTSPLFRGCSVRAEADDEMKHTECRESKQCAPAKHHFDHCVERVNAQVAEGGAKEDCVEECMWPAPPFPRRSGRCPSGLLTRANSLPPRPLRHPVRCTQALVHPQINHPLLHDGLYRIPTTGAGVSSGHGLKRFFSVHIWLL